MNKIDWSSQEQAIAHQAIQNAYARETHALIQLINQQASQIHDIGEVWRLHDYLSARRHQIDGKYDERPATLLFVFADLIKEGWLNLEDLQGLDPDKLAKIFSLAKM
ncbi:MAG: hypothetical protein GC158_10515 [Cyanobacteria bacterium RI_101]|nr:hypothetical protein [Cyanobacteria bacterium RI_101]